jgi:hypothetical protein
LGLTKGAIKWKAFWRSSPLTGAKSCKYKAENVGSVRDQYHFGRRRRIKNTSSQNQQVHPKDVKMKHPHLDE